MKRQKTALRLPLDVILEILVWLPAKSALQFKSVCKEWYNLINTPLFAKLHVNKSLKPDSRHNRALFCSSTLSIVDDLYHPVKWTKLNWPKDTIIDDDNRHLVGSCNGLVCFKVYPNSNDPTLCLSTVRYFLICNPTTRTFKLVLPSPEIKWSLRASSYGFGYDSVHDDYKIVSTNYVWAESVSYPSVCIYSLKADLWSCPTSPTRVSSGRTWENRRTTVFRNNIVHYLLSIQKQYFTFDYRIARFDIASEKWTDDLSFPVQVKNNIIFGELDGWLYVHDFFSRDVWIMEEHGSWKKMFHLPRDLAWDYLIARSRDGHHRLLLQYYYGYKHYLEWYNHRNNRRVPFELEGTVWHGVGGSRVLCIIASLVGIPGCSSTKLQEIYVIQRRRVERRM